ncbi:hypothetical protein KC328_g123 [Hortaea werneckii]|nr:hypothetical protein KC328_g123 [Hortaea werneckii]
MAVITIGNTASGKVSRLNNVNAGKTISVVRGACEVATKTAKVEHDTKKGVVLQVKFAIAVTAPIFRSLDALHVVQDFGHQPCTRILVLHLALLQSLTDASDEAINRNHGKHRTQASQHADAHQLVKRNQAKPKSCKRCIDAVKALLTRIPVSKARWKYWCKQAVCSRKGLSSFQASSNSMKALPYSLYPYRIMGVIHPKVRPLRKPIDASAYARREDRKLYTVDHKQSQPVDQHNATTPKLTKYKTVDQNRKSLYQTPANLSICSAACSATTTIKVPKTVSLA